MEIITSIEKEQAKRNQEENEHLIQLSNIIAQIEG